MDRLKMVRKSGRSAITKTVNELTAEVERENPGLVELQVLLQRLEVISEEVEDLDQKVLGLMLDGPCTEEEYENEKTTIIGYKDKISRAKIRAGRILNKTPSPPPSSAGGYVSVFSDAGSGGTQKQKRFKLPKIELPKFDGVLQKWLGWWSQFEKIHEQEDLHASDKFQYLIQATENKSEARDIVESFPPTGDNYELAIAALKERYGREDLQLQVYLRQLLGLVINNAGKKEKIGVDKLYLKLESALRSLRTLNLSKADPSMYFYPLVESSLPEEILRAWQRSPMSRIDDGSVEKLDMLMKFLKTEVQGEQQIALARSGFSNEPQKKQENKKKASIAREGEDVPTAAGLHEAKVKDKECIFCGKSNHSSADCYRAHSMSLEERRIKVKDSRACYVCLRKGHGAKVCRSAVKCKMCSRRHYNLMCPDLSQQRPSSDSGNQSVVNQASTETSSYQSSIQCDGEVLLKTVLVRVRNNKESRIVRLLFDEGSQKSYVTSYISNGIKSKPVGDEVVRNVMIDGSVTSPRRYNKHEMELVSVDGKVNRKLLLRERPQIGGIPPRARVGPWLQQLQRDSIFISDHCQTPLERADIDILIGGDYREQLMTGRRIDLKFGLFAIESVFGWMLCGPTCSVDQSATEMVIHSYLSGDISQLWDLETIGIQESATKVSREENDLQVKETFQKKVTRDEDGRYVVKLPWIHDDLKFTIPDNKSVCEKRLVSATRKLQNQEQDQVYADIFKGWESEKMINQVRENNSASGHYLPHRPVFKPDSLTTPVRPVFDASCKVASFPSLNQCLEKGPNMLELIPSILLRFREKKVGVISDIRKAFQMIGVAEEDRKYQRFLWWEDLDYNILKIYEHCRVVFGMTCSPFILAAVLDIHLSQAPTELIKVAELIRKSLYVDNCVLSFNHKEDYMAFKESSVEIMADAKMELRQWESNADELIEGSYITTVLGLKWDKKEDVLFCQLPKEVAEEYKITKRRVLSVVSQIFEPIGYACPSLLLPKLMLQEAWSRDLGWDDEWDEENRIRFETWFTEIDCLSKIRIPRNAVPRTPRQSESSLLQIHTFTDASQGAYAAVVFARVANGKDVSVQLLAAKSRVAPLDKKQKKRVTIPRLELLGCLVGSRLTSVVKEALGLVDTPIHYWTDSTTAKAWIEREADWGTFVGNRVKEIAELTRGSKWRHVPGTLNPADLPSRGCSPQELLESKWWEGPSWLKKAEDEWPRSAPLPEEDQINLERRRTEHAAVEIQVPRFSSYLKNVKVAAWVRRFVNNARTSKEFRQYSVYPTFKELREGERDIVRKIQQRHYPEKFEIKNLKVDRRDDELLHVDTRLLYKEDTEGFRHPILLPKEDPLVHQLIEYIHMAYNHAGTQFVLGKLRERYWIIQGRKTVGRVIQSCTVCRRYSAKSLESDPAPLPQDRIETVAAFQITGVDLAGPVILRGGEKAWIVLYTCAVYRGVYLDIVTSLSSEAFLHSLERFVSTIGRPKRIFSDNGTNFVGAVNLMKMIDWSRMEDELQVKQITWTFNPPASPWWGGWFERLVRSVKEILRKMLGTAKLSFDEMRTCLAAVSCTINDRPLTALTEDGDDLIALTPNMFMRDLPIACFPEGKEIGANELCGSYNKMQAIKEGLQARFRKEYLGILVQKKSETKSRPPQVGDIVLVGSENKKRFEWPLGKIMKLFPGKDGKIRVAEVKICKNPRGQNFSTTILTRPLQRLYPLEMQKVSDVPTSKKEAVISVQDDEVPIKTRVGRPVKRPIRYGEWNN